MNDADRQATDTDQRSMKYEFDVDGMTCAACVTNVESALKSIEGIQNVSVNLATDSAQVFSSNPISIDQLTKTVSRAGYRLEPKGSTSLLEKQQQRISKWQRLLLIQVVFGVPLLIYAMSEMMLGIHVFSRNLGILIQFILATVLVISGSGYYRRGFRHLIMRAPNMDSLVALGTGAAYIYSLIASINMLMDLGIEGFDALYFEAAGTILLFITFGKWLEAKARGKTTEALSGLMDEMPNQAEVFRNNSWQILSLDQIEVDDLIRVKPHTKIPVDGLIIEGSTSVDESSISGESIPVDKHVGSYVVAASMNLQSAFEMHAKKIGRDSLFGQIISLVENAQSKKPAIQLRVDRIATVFVPVVITLALLSAAVWLILGYGLTFAMNIMISVLIIACPCALGLATPTALVVASGIAANRGILFKTPDAFQLYAGIDHILLDKTGTLTKGEVQVASIIQEDDSQFMPIALGLSQSSDHPLSKAIVAYGKGLGETPVQIESLNEVPGKGLRGIYQDQEVTLERIDDELTLPEIFNVALRNYRENAFSVSMVLRGDSVIGLIAFTDEVKSEAGTVLKYFRDHQIETGMLTGDQAAIAKVVGEQLGITDIHSEILPASKHEEVRKVQASGKLVAMVGDGINDAPALVGAEVGLSFSSGTDIAVNAADIIFLNPSLTNLVSAHRISKATVSKINQNLFWAFIYNSVGIPLAMGLLYPFTGSLLNPMFAGLAMALSSVSVVGNTLLMRTGKYFGERQ